MIVGITANTKATAFTQNIFKSIMLDIDSLIKPLLIRITATTKKKAVIRC